MGIASIADVAAKVPRARPSLLLCMAPPQGMDQDRSVASEVGALSASVEARTRTSHGPRFRAEPAKTEVPVRASERSTGAGTLAGSQLQLWTMCTRRPSGEVPVVAVTDAGRSRHALLAAGTSHSASASARARAGPPRAPRGTGPSHWASAWARSRPGAVRAVVTRPAPWARVVTAGQRPK